MRTVWQYLALESDVSYDRYGDADVGIQPRAFQYRGESEHGIQRWCPAPARDRAESRGRVSPVRRDEGERLRHEAVCRHLGVLSPAEISGLRKGFGMSRAAFAELTGLGEASLGRWESGAVIQNRANDRYLRLLSLPGLIGSLAELVASGVSARRSSTSQDSESAGRGRETSGSFGFHQR